MSTPTDSKNLLATPWAQLTLGIISVACVANLQYGWTLFVNPIDARHHWGTAAIQIAFTLFVLLETWLVPLEGYLVDRLGPGVVVLCAGALVAASWLVDSAATSLPMLYLGGALAGIGAGCVYGTCIGQALKWFPGNRGLAAGLISAGFGIGSALTVGPLEATIEARGYEHAFVVFGLIQGGLVVLMSFGMLSPPAVLQSAWSPEQTRRDYGPRFVLRSPLFYLMYLLYVMVSFGGLTLAASIAPIAQSLGLDANRQLEWLSLPTLTLALSLSRLSDGLSRPLFGWISDRIGREMTMALAFIIGGGALLLLEGYGSDPVSFILITTIYFGVYGEIFSLFPATAADTFGARFATVNVGLLYTAKGVASLLVPIAVSMAQGRGWGLIFTLAMCCNLLAALLAVVVLGPMRQRHFERAAEGEATVFPVVGLGRRRI